MFFQKPHPISQLMLSRIFIGFIVLLALIAGYFYTQNQRFMKWCLQNMDCKIEMTEGFK